MIQRSNILASLAWYLTVCVQLSIAAPITWSPAEDFRGPISISTDGTLIEAVNANIEQDRLTVAVDSENITFEPGTFEVQMSPPISVIIGMAVIGHPELDIILDSQAFDPEPWSFTLDGLSSGKTYQIQVLASGSGVTSVIFPAQDTRIGDGENPENISAELANTGPASVIGTFVADGPVQTISVLPGLGPDKFAAISAYILRDVTPVPPDDIFLSHHVVTPEAASGTFLAVIDTIDVNDMDTHSLSLIDSENFPDNEFFSIENENELRAAATLGQHGQSYQIKVRATDSQSLSYEEVLVILVRRVGPINSVSIDDGGVRLTVPTYPGRVLGLEYSSNLQSGTWVELGNFFDLNGSTSEFTDPDHVRIARGRGFYRAFLRPISP